MILKLESPTDECRYCTLTNTINYATLFDWLLWHQILKPRNRCFGMVTHVMGMTVREDHQLTLGEQHRLAYPFHREPACSSCHNMEARNLPA